MMMEEDFTWLVREIEKLGYDEKTAVRYAVLIGDTPISDGAGNTVVREQDGRELARLPLTFFNS